MNDIIYFLLVILTSFLAGAFICAFFIFQILKYSKRKGLYDSTGERKVHKGNVSRLGGLAFLPTLVLTAAPVLLYYDLQSVGRAINVIWPYFLLIGLFLIFLIGLLDDLVGVGAKRKLLIQIASSVCLPLTGLFVDNLYGFAGIGEVHALVAWGLTIFLPLLLMNAYNLIDGIDGLASGLSLFAFLVFGVFFSLRGMYLYGLLSFTLSGILVGFMYFNIFHSVASGRKIFMGDSGSLFLGYMMAFVCLKYSMNLECRYPYSCDGLLIPYSLVIVPVFDVVRVSLYRLRKGLGIFTPDKSHIHHRLMACGISQRKALLSILGLAVGFFVINLIAFPYVGITMVVIIDVVLWVAFHMFLSKKIKSEPSAESKA